MGAKLIGAGDEDTLATPIRGVIEADCLGVTCVDAACVEVAGLVAAEADDGKADATGGDTIGH